MSDSLSSAPVGGGVASDEIVDLVDIEECGKANRKPPNARQYRIRIDKQRHVVDVPAMTGQELLVLAEKTPPERYTISQKMHGGQSHVIDLNEEADFTAPGVERFMTLPLDQTEG